MQWIWDLSQLVFAAVLGFGGGSLAVFRDRKRRKKEAEQAKKAQVEKDIEMAKEADWSISWLRDNTWVLANTGTAKARAIDVRFTDFALGRSNVRDPMYEGEEASFNGVRRSRSAVALISWTNRRGERVGPVRRAIPPRGFGPLDERDTGRQESSPRAAGPRPAEPVRYIPTRNGNRGSTRGPAG